MNRIRQLREEKNITQVRLSIELEVSQETISAYEMGKHYPSVKSLLKLRRIFGVNTDYILGLSEQRYDIPSADALPADEAELLHSYRLLDEVGREKIKSYLDGYLSSMSRPSHPQLPSNPPYKLPDK